MHSFPFQLLFLPLILLSGGCTVQTLYDQVPPAARELVLDVEVQILACHSQLFSPRYELGPEAICVNLFTPERVEGFGVDLSASTIALDDEPRQPFVELMPEDGKPALSTRVSAEIRRDHIAGYSPARTGVPKVIVLFPANAVQSLDTLFEVSPLGRRRISLDLLFTFGEQRQQVQRRFEMVSRDKFITLLDL